ncbi:MAG: peptidylprolyl isomerase [Paracoccaceae bacterium]
MTRLPSLVGAAMLFAASALAALAEEPTAATVVAKVNSTEITLGQMISVRESLPQKYLTLPDDVLFKGVLDQIIQQTVLAQKAEGALTEAQRLELEQQRRGYLANVTLTAAVDAAVTEEAVKKAYDETYGSAAPASEFHAAHILVKTEDEAKKIKEDLDAGGDFAEIAKRSSGDPGSAQSGGDLGWFGAGIMVEPFEKAVTALKPGETSAPVETQFGFHIIRLIETRAAAALTLEEKRDEIVAGLQQKAVENEVKSLTEAASVERMDEGIDPAVLKKAELIGK